MSVPKQRKPGQTGGGGRIGQTGNRVKSSNRGGRPHAGGGGGGRKPPKKGSGGGSSAMVFLSVALLAVPALAVAGIVAFLAHGYGLF